MAVNLPPLGLLRPVPGIRLGTACAGIKQRQREDLALIELAPGTAAAGLFTQNGFRAPPVAIAERRIRAGRPRLLLINSGNANAATGAPGFEDALALCEHAAQCVGGGLSAEAVLPFSTGVIGERLPVPAMKPAIRRAAQGLAADQWESVARAMMTTDTAPKAESRQVRIEGAELSITGIAKGAGMIKPNMATMLAFLCCDAKVAGPALDQLARQVAARSFNRITVDGDTSTNDAFLICATGQAGHAEIQAAGPAWEALRAGLEAVAAALAERIVRDAEGATRLVAVQVGGGATDAECLQVAYALAESPLVKTAIHAGDPNWGRFCMAIGRAGLENLDPSKVSLDLNEVPVVRAGLAAPNYDEAAAAAAMSQDECRIHAQLGRGPCQQTVLTCDLSAEYIRINSDYRT